MPKQFIEKDAITDRAYSLALSDGLHAVSVRAVAQACGVSVGSIYNYFPAKDDLVAAVIERFFTDAFFEDFCHPATDENFLCYCRRLYASMRETLRRFRADWLSQIRGMGASVREAAKKLEADRLVHVRQGLEHVLVNDPEIRPGALSGALDAESLCAFTLRSMMSALEDIDGDCDVLFALLGCLLYGKTDSRRYGEEDDGQEDVA